MSERSCAAPRAWLLALAIPHGPWRCLLYLWTWGPFWGDSDALPATGSVRVWPSKSRIAADLGVPAATVHTWIMWLTRKGWIRRELDAEQRDAWVLAVVAPFQPAPGGCQLKPGRVLTNTRGVSVETREGVDQHPNLAPILELSSTEPNTTAGEPAPVEGHPCTVEDSPGATPARAEPDDPNPPSPSPIGSSSPPVSESAADPSRPSPPLARKRKASEPKPGQTALAIGDPPESDAVTDLLALHQRLRRAAQKAHGQRETWLPSPTSDTGRSLRLRLRKAVDEHGADACRRALEWQASGAGNDSAWARDPGSLARWSTDSMWSPKSLAVSIPRSAGQAQARASPSRRDPAPLSCEPSGLQMPRIVIDPNAKCL
jgi:hypothetical protein